MFDILQSIGSFDMCNRAPKADEPPPQAELTGAREKQFSDRSFENKVTEPVKAKPVHFGKDATVDEAISAVLRNNLEQFMGNCAAFRETDHPEAVHQLRVALRRLRCALQIIERALPHPAFKALRTEARRLALILGPTREYDALRSSIADLPISGATRSSDFAALFELLEAKRRAAYKIAREQFDERSASDFTASLQGLLTNRYWNSSHPANGENALARDLATDALVRLRKRVLKRGADFPDISDEARHKLRIALKNMHYGIDFFGHLFKHPRKRKHYLSCVSALQSQLGAFNDILNARKILAGFSTVEQASVAENSQFLLGWFACEAAKADVPHHKLWTAFKRADVFWD
jgi:triphosphatase